MRNLLFVVFLLFVFSCKKKTTDVLITDFSINTENSLSEIIFVRSKAVIAGGTRHYQSAVYVLDTQNNLYTSPIAANNDHKELRGIDINSEGKMIAVGYSGNIFISTDTGAHWQFVQNGSWKDFLGVSFRDKDSAFIASGVPFSKGGLLRVDNTGAGPGVLQDERNFSIEEIDFVSSTVGYLCGYGAIMKTTDGGRVWDFTSAKNDNFKAMAWKNINEGIAVGYEGSILLTADGGTTWHVSRNGNNFLKKKMHLTDIAFNDKSSYAIVGEKGLVLISGDDGSTWKEIKNFTTKDLKGVAFKNQSECLVSGESGALFLLKL